MMGWAFYLKVQLHRQENSTVNSSSPLFRMGIASLLMTVEVLWLICISQLYLWLPKDSISLEKLITSGANIKYLERTVYIKLHRIQKWSNSSCFLERKFSHNNNILWFTQQHSATATKQSVFQPAPKPESCHECLYWKPKKKKKEKATSHCVCISQM